MGTEATDPELARTTAKEALSLARSTGEPHAIRLSAQTLGETETRLGYYDSAVTHLEEALAVAVGLGLQTIATGIRDSRADVELLRGNCAEAANGSTSRPI